MQKQRDAVASGVSSGLSGSTELRLRNQLERAYQQCFGAEEGLRVLVTLATTQMLAARSTRTAIRTALTRLVTEHPIGAAATGKPSNGNGNGNGHGSQPRTAALLAMMLKWSDRTGRE
jgi:hypothetical protein